MITAIILRGISGVGKSFLSKLLKKAIEKIGKKVFEISKDQYRKYLEEREGYHYTKEEEIKVTNWYVDTFYKAAERDDLDYIICDNTHVRKTELLIPFSTLGNISRYVVIEVGSPASPTNSTIGSEVVERQRKEMTESKPQLEALYLQDMTDIINIPERSGSPEDADNIIHDIEYII